jgi:transcriptional regulator with GAF, ATPase, and Fis domain
MTDTKTHYAGDIETLTCKRFTLRITQGVDEGRTFTSNAHLTKIGAHPDCELDLNDRSASRFHASIEMDPFGHRLVDKQSKNGTFVNGLRARDVYLSAHSTIRIGETLIEYVPDETSIDLEFSTEKKFGEMLGESAIMRQIFAMLSKVSPSEITVLVEGESGTGKELVAQAVHLNSKRASGPFIVFDCSAVAPSLIESELFGHVKGAFTGAISSRDGAFVQANGGTLFLDELGELPLDLQPKLLRAIEQRAVRPVGGNASQSVDVRIVAATNRDLAAQVEEGLFRSDLYYRLAVLKVSLPALRDRVDDIPILVEHFLSQNEHSTGIRVQVGYETIRKLQKHGWPGNIRELKNFVDRAAVLATEDRLETRFLMDPVGQTAQTSDETGSPEPSDAASAVLTGLPFKDAKARLINQFERDYWTILLEQTEGNVSAAARQAGIHRKSAEYLLRKLDLNANQGD